MEYRTIEFVPADEAVWVEELHALLTDQALEQYRLVGSVTREIVGARFSGATGQTASFQSTALVFAKEDV